MVSKNLKILEKEALKEALNTHYVEILFTKVDGSLRNMICTRDHRLIESDPAFIKPDETKEKKAPKKVNEDVLTIYEKNKGWKSFKYSTVLKTSVILE
jgi:hypothetical protein